MRLVSGDIGGGSRGISGGIGADDANGRVDKTE